MKLRTLKDIEMGAIARSELRQEAVNWVKNCNCEHRTFPGICFACRRFKEFFNLTEGDLNEEKNK